MIPTSKVMEWRYKDADRKHWIIQAWNDGSHVDAGGIHSEWAYEILSDEVQPPASVWRGEFVGQYDAPPTLKDIITDFAQHAVAMAIDCATVGGEPRIIEQ